MAKPSRKITATTHAPVRIFEGTYTTFPVGRAFGAPRNERPLAATATLDTLDSVRHGDACPLCFVERALTGSCGTCQ